MSQEKALPKEWKWVKLGEIADYLNGRAFKPTEWEEQGLPIIRIQNLNKPDARYNYSSQIFEDKYRVEKGDLLFAWSASLGAYIWRNDNAWLNQHIFKVVPKKICNKIYLFYALEKIVLELYAVAHGSGMVHITKGKFEATQIPLPPLSIQAQIVEKLETLLSELDKGKAQLLTAQAQLKTYRQAVLKYAFEGKLTGNTEGWQWVKLGEVCSKISDGPFGSNLKSSDYIESGVRVIRLENIGALQFKDEYQTFVSEEKYNTISRHTVSSGDIIFASFIANEIKVVILPESIQRAINKADCFCIRNSNRIDKKYLVYYLSSHDLYKQLENEVHGATRPRINTTQLKQALINLPPLSTQAEIVTEIERRLSVCDHLEGTIKTGLAQSETLRQSLLKQAFEGRLI
jgi:type I restriction enzyme, S subunit